MKKALCFWILIFFILPPVYSQNNNFYAANWKEVQKNELKALNRSALTEVNKIYEKAKEDSNHIQVIKALIYKSKFSLLLEEDAQLQVINKFKEELDSASAPAKNILNHIVANIYWQYYQQNRYRFYSRTNTEEKVDVDDFRTWDLQTLFEEIHHHYQRSLDNPQLIQKVSLKEFDDILMSQGGSRIYRPTLYDFLAHGAIGFYKNDDRNLNRPSYKFEVVDEDLLSNNELFLKAKLEARDSLSQMLHALYIYQDLTRFHLENERPEALVQLTLDRLSFVKGQAVFSNKEEVYLQTLSELEQIYKDNEVVTEVMYEMGAYFEKLSQAFHSKSNTDHRWKLKDALEICDQATKKFPNSSGVKKCSALRANILHKSISITAEQFISRDKESKVLVDYRNVDQLYFRVYKISFDDRNKLPSIYKDSERLAYLNELKVGKQWTSRLRDEGDFMSHSSEVRLPELACGSYIVVASEHLQLNEGDSYGLYLFASK